MTVTLSIKNVPDELAQRLKERAVLTHQSIIKTTFLLYKTAGSATAVG